MSFTFVQTEISGILENSDWEASLNVRGDYYVEQL